MKPKRINRTLLGALSLLISSTAVHAGKADVVEVTASKTGSGFFHFDVTVRHADAGWKHYANKWDIIGPGGKVLGTRVLHHPHVSEQPFTRSLSGVRIPKSVKRVTVRAYDSRHGSGGKTITLDINH